MFRLLPEFYLILYNRLLQWIELQHDIEREPLPSSEKEKWEVERVYQEVKNGKTTPVTQKISRKELGYEGSYFQQKKRDANNILKEKKEDTYIKIKSNLLHQIFLVLGCNSVNNKLFELFEDFCIKFQVGSDVAHIQKTLFPRAATTTRIEENVLVKELTSEIQHIKNAESVVKTFYECIASKIKLSEAWELLSPRFQEKVFGNEFKRFEDGYINTNGLRNIHIFNTIQSTQSIIDCHVYYEDEVAVQILTDLISMDLLTVAEIDKFVDRVRNLRNYIEEKGGKKFEKIELYKLFEPAASEYIWYKCGFSTDQLPELFITSKLTVIKRLYWCSCILYNDNWYIDTIRTMRTFSSR